MVVACTDSTVVSEVQAVLQQYAVAGVREQGPNIGSPNNLKTKIGERRSVS
jgi:hypothetical protein